MSEQPLLSAKKICKEFGPTRALIDADLDVRRGEIRGLIGENGSGKSTLAAIIAGALYANSGCLEIEGEHYSPKSMVDAQDHGISLIVQEMGSIGSIDVASNVFAGRLNEFSRFGFLNIKKMHSRANEILSSIGAPEIRAEMMTRTLNFEDRKIVEIARAMACNPDLLIIDETTTALAHKGRELLYKLIKKMNDENKAVLFISHDLDELMRICNTITVLRDGVIIDTLDKENISIDKMRLLMIGRELVGSYFRADTESCYDNEVVLEAKQITFGPLENFDLKLHKGEILGIAGLSACGMHELGRVLFGIEKPITGSVMLKEKDILIRNPDIAIKNKMAYVSKERDREAIILNASIQDNIVLPSLPQLSKIFGLITNRSEMNMARKQIEVMRIKCKDEKQSVSALSGGNKQKVVFSKWMAKESKILILDCPTRGIDVGVKATMYKLMEAQKAQGKSIVMISEELMELIGMCDRILAIKDGILQAEIKRGIDMNEIQLINNII